MAEKRDREIGGNGVEWNGLEWMGWMEKREEDRTGGKTVADRGGRARERDLESEREGGSYRADPPCPNSHLI